MTLTRKRRELIALMREGWTVSTSPNCVAPGELRHHPTLRVSQFYCRPPPDVDRPEFPIPASELNTLHKFGVLRKFRRCGAPYYTLDQEWERDE